MAVKEKVLDFANKVSSKNAAQKMQSSRKIRNIEFWSLLLRTKWRKWRSASSFVYRRALKKLRLVR